MTQADRVLSTPPLNTPIDTNRRRFLTVAAVASFVGAGSLAAAAMAPGIPMAVTSPPASPELRAAIRDLERAHANLKIAQASNEEAESMWTDWQAQNPQPASKRGTRRWIKRGSAYHQRLTAPSWQALMQAEMDFATAQTVLAAVRIASVDDFKTMIAAAEHYDSVELCRVNRAPIARTVVAYFARARGVQS
jgi:hypothetical protein